MGNGDAHSNNYSLLLSRHGEVALAPLYDSAPVMYLESRIKGTGHVANQGHGACHQRAHEYRLGGCVRPRGRGAVALPAGVEEITDRLEALWIRRQWTVGGP
ncbi:hypothetical protein [Nocardia sp. NPDC058666]|uniref:hypothetical protein n=1 Tax=Nocardia sp. NPDC058666 TaxID=3346587 RepID=UPI0036663815